MSKSHRNCVVPGCPNRRDRCKWGLFPADEKVGGRRLYEKRRLCGSEDGCGNKSEECRSVTFSRIPKDSKTRRELRKEWLRKIPRVNIPPSSHSCVCSVHFVGGVCDSRKGDVPEIFEGHRVLAEARSTRSSLGLDQLRTVDTSMASTSKEEASAESSDEEAVVETLLQDHFYSAKNCDLLQRTVQELTDRVAGLEQRLSSTLDLLASTQKDLRACRSTFKSMSEDPVLFRFYTGISVVTFARIRAVLQESPQDMDYTGSKKGEHSGRGIQGYPRKLSLDDELLLVLIKLRHDFPESDLGNRFAVSQSTVSRIFSTWILCLFYTFKEVSIWPSRQLVDLHMPDAFKRKYPTTRVVIDATEFKIEKPANPDVQAKTWSSYKNCNTFKLLVGVTPGGVISFLSPLWSGRVSDKEITKRSGLLDLLEPGDSIMADRGFDIASIMPEGTAVNIPPFLESKSQFDEDQLVETRRIASLRIHVERAIERIKNFRITHFFPASLCPLAEPIIFVCSFLTIFEAPLLPPITK